MSDARNDYPRLCWGCLGIIADYQGDYANLNYGGRCASCASAHVPDIAALREHTDRMNSVIDRDALLRVAFEGR